MNVGDNGYETLMVTDEDEVLACGEKMYDCLGLKKDPFLTIPVRVPGLSKEKVKGKLYFGKDHVLFQEACGNMSNQCCSRVSYKVKWKIGN